MKYSETCLSNQPFMGHDKIALLPCLRSASGDKVIGAGVHIHVCIYIYVCGRNIFLNHNLAIDSPFQTLAVGLLVEFID